jgi:hypothetical protein
LTAFSNPKKKDFKYDLKVCNCEHFATHCRFGSGDFIPGQSGFSEQVEALGLCFVCKALAPILLKNKNAKKECRPYSSSTE